MQQELTPIKHSIFKYTQSILLYAVVGGCAALVEWSVFYGAVALLSWPYLMAALLGFLIATWINWLLSRNVAFLRRDGSTRRDLYSVYIASAVALAFNLLIMTVLIEMAGINVLAAKIAGTGVGFFLNYIARQFFIYSSTPLTLSEGAGRARHLLVENENLSKGELTRKSTVA